MINKYKELHERLMDCVLEYHNIQTSWILKQTQEKTGRLRKVLSEMRKIESEMRMLAQALMREESKRKREKWNKQKETQK
jgi:hypothetical protein